MAITFTTPHQRPDSGGVYTIQQFARYAARLVEVHLVVVKGDPQPVEGVHVHGPEALERLELPEADALLIHADMPDAAALFELPADRGAPLAFFQGYSTPDKEVVHENLRRARHAICVSSWLVTEANRVGCAASLVRNGLDRSIFYPGSEADTRRRRVVMPASPAPGKGTADGVAALQLVADELPDTEFRLFGSADPGFKPATLLASPPAQRFEIAELMRSAAVFVCPSWEEGLGLPGIEAIACGAALATCDTKGSREYAVHQRTALVSQPRQPETLARSILDLLRDPDLRRGLVRNGMTQLEGTYPDWERATAVFLDTVNAAVTNQDESPTFARLRREIHRAQEKVQTAESEREQLEADLRRQLAAVTEARGRLRVAEAERAAEREAREQAVAAQADAEANATTTREELAAARSQIDELEAAIKRGAEALDAAQVQIRTATDAHDAQAAQLESVLAQARTEAAVLAAERDELRRQLAEQLRPARADSESPPPALAAMSADGDTVAMSVLTFAQATQLPGATATEMLIPAAEREARASFIATYRELVGDLPVEPDGRDPLSLPVASDLQGLLAGVGDDQGDETTVDIVICVHNALDDVRACLWALLHKGSRRFRLIVVNDGSDAETTSLLKDFAARHPAVTLIDNQDPPHGYTIAANLGLGATASDYVVMLNSDTVVSRGWLERIVSYGEARPEVGILGPLSNAASHQSVPARRDGSSWAINPLPNWLTVDGIALLIERAVPRAEARLPFLNGFCYVVKRAVVDAIGTFDEESFPAGFAEENDYSQRARDAGFELAVVDNAYVYHSKSRSYGVSGRKTIADRHYKIFLRKHGKAKITRLVSEMESSTSLEQLRAVLGDAISSPPSTRSAVMDASDLALAVTFVLPGLSAGGSGGSHSIYQEVRGLRQLGVNAQIALRRGALDRARAAYEDADDVFVPFRDDEELAHCTRASNVIVATHFKSVASVASLQRQRDDFLPAYYVQDYEPMFQFADRADAVEAAQSYTAMPGALLFAKTHWLCNVVSRRHGVYVAKVEPSIDERVYRVDEPRVPGSRVRVAAMVRPRTPRRQPHTTVAVLERLLSTHPRAVDVITFGCTATEIKRITHSERIRSSHLGLLTRERVAEVLRGCDVFFDLSTYQAFGRTALEAMACGCTAVVPVAGGVTEFVQSGMNAITVDSLSPDASYEALAGLIDDRDQLLALQAAGRTTASRYSILRSALSEYVLFRSAYLSRTR